MVAFALAIAVSCGGSTGGTGAVSTGAAATSAVATSGTSTSGGTASTGPSTTSPAFGQVLASAGATEYKVTYKLTDGGEQSWFFKPPKTRFDFSSTVSGQTSVISIYALPDGAFTCFSGTGAAAQCIGMSGLQTALQQNPAALYTETMIQHPEQFSGVLVETRQIAGQQAFCYDVRAAAAIASLSDGRFCYSSQGILLLERFPGFSMEATTFSTTVPDSDFALPARPTVIGTP